MIRSSTLALLMCCVLFACDDNDEATPSEGTGGAGGAGGEAGTGGEAGAGGAGGEAGAGG